MTGFVIAAVVLTAIVVALLLVPLLVRERHLDVGSASELSITVLREQLNELDAQRLEGLLDTAALAEERADLEKRALEDGVRASNDAIADSSGRRKGLAAMVGAFVPVLAVGFYVWLGSPEAFNPQKSQDVSGNHALDPQQIQNMATKLAERLQNNPGDGEGWLMLGRSYSVLGRYAEAAAAFSRATAILPPDANLLADYADVVAMAQGRRLAGEPEKIIARALEINPAHIKSLALAGSASFERRDYDSAIREWRKILPLVPPDSQAAKSINNSIADAESRMGRSPSSQPRLEIAGKPTQTNEASVAGTVNLGSGVRDKVPANATLFVFARNTDGSRVPLAMLKVASAKLPFKFSLDDSMSMMPTAKLSNAKAVIVGARLSASGDAIAKPGDLEGFSQPAAVGAKGITVTIDTPVK